MGRRKATPSDTPAADPQPAPLPASLLRRRVVFARPHQHAGVHYAAGEWLMVTDQEADLLRHFNAIEAD